LKLLQLTVRKSCKI